MARAKECQLDEGPVAKFSKYVHLMVDKCALIYLMVKRA